MQYVYGMTARGFSLGCQPMEDFSECLEDTSDTFYNILVYNRMLSDKEISDYELVFLGKISR